jgi:hypothetical protein
MNLLGPNSVTACLDCFEPTQWTHVCPLNLAGVQGIHLLDSRLDTLILSPLHQVFDGAKQSLERLLAQAGNLDVRRGHDTSSSRGVIEQRKLTKVVSLLVMEDAVRRVSLICVCLTTLQEIERMTRVTLLNDNLSRHELLRLEGVCNLGSLVWGDCLEKRDLLEEILVHSSSRKRRLHKNTSERIAIKRPEGTATLRRDDRRSAGGIVHERKLTERATSLDFADLVAHAIYTRLKDTGRVNVNFEGSPLNNVEEVASISLDDDLKTPVNTTYTSRGNRFAYLDSLGRNWFLI